MLTNAQTDFHFSFGRIGYRLSRGCRFWLIHCGMCRRRYFHSVRDISADELTLPTLINDPRFLPQLDLRLRPSAARGPIGRDGSLEVVHAGEVLHDVVALVIPDIDAERKVRLGGHARSRTPVWKMRTDREHTQG